MWSSFNSPMASGPCNQMCGGLKPQRQCNQCGYISNPEGTACMKLGGPAHQRYAGIQPKTSMKPCDFDEGRKWELAKAANYHGRMTNPNQCIKLDGNAHRRMKGLPPLPKKEYVYKTPCGQRLPPAMPVCGTSCSGVPSYQHNMIPRQSSMSFGGWTH
jgi:hypothetical protein